MPFDDLKQLPNLVRFRLSPHVLEIYEFRYTRMDEDVVAAVDPGKPEAERLRESTRLSEPEIVRSAKCPFEKLPWIHATILPRRGQSEEASIRVRRNETSVFVLRLTKSSSAASVASPLERGVRLRRKPVGLEWSSMLGRLIGTATRPNKCDSEARELDLLI